MTLRQHVSDILAGRRLPGAAVLDALGLERGEREPEFRRKK